MDVTEYFPLPFKLLGIQVFSSNSQVFDFIGYADELQRQMVVDVINGKNIKRLKNKLTFIKDKGEITLDGKPFIRIRGWGYLTGGGALNLLKWC